MKVDKNSGCWKIEFETPDFLKEDILQILEAYSDAVTFFLKEPSGKVLFNGYFNFPPDIEAIRTELKKVVENVDIPVPKFNSIDLSSIDWISENRKNFEPLEVGGFTITDSDHKGIFPNCTSKIVIDASTAFGTGHHGTTKGCLTALNEICNRERLPSGHLLDMGCGTGILGIAAAKKLHRKIIMVDNDSEAINKTSYNLKKNRLQLSRRPFFSQGYNSREVIIQSPYALILSNILAKPIVKMAPYCARYLRQGGYAILSGFLINQETLIIAVHRKMGLIPYKRYRIEGWSTLVFRK